MGTVRECVRSMASGEVTREGEGDEKWVSTVVAGVKRTEVRCEDKVNDAWLQYGFEFWKTRILHFPRDLRRRTRQTGA